MDAIKNDVNAAGSSDVAKRIEAVAGRLPQMQGDINREFSSAGGLFRPIESFSSLPTADQQRQIDTTFEDATKTVTDLNRIIQVEIPGLYAQFAKQTWPKPVTPVPAIRR